MFNKDLREYAKGKGVRLWQVAQELGYTNAEMFSRKFARVEFDADQKADFMAAVDKIAG